MMKNKYLSIFLLFLFIDFTSGQIELIATSDKNVLKATGSYRGEQFGYVTEDGLYTIYNGIKALHSNADYIINDQNFSTSLVNNIKEMSCDSDGRIYVSTKDDHIIMFEQGKVFAGLPLKSSDFHLNFDGYVCTNLLVKADWFVAELLEKPTNFDDMFGSNTYPEIQGTLNLIKPDQLSINEQELSVVTGENKRDIAYPLENKLIWQKANESYIPCDRIVDISSSRISFIGVQGVHYQIYTLCETGDVWVWTRKRSTNNDMKPKFTAGEWTKLNFSGITSSQIVELTHVDRNFIIASTNSNQNGLIIYNVQKKIACSIDLPGNTPIQDFFFSPYESIAVVATGKNVFAIDIDAEGCQQGISQTVERSESTISINPNPSDGKFTIQLPEGSTDKGELHIRDMKGRSVYFKPYFNEQTSITIETELRPGIYIVQIIDKSGVLNIGKCIIY